MEASTTAKGAVGRNLPESRRVCSDHTYGALVNCLGTIGLTFPGCNYSRKSLYRRGSRVRGRSSMCR